jgi:hypothetical protein
MVGIAVKLRALLVSALLLSTANVEAAVAHVQTTKTVDNVIASHLTTTGSMTTTAGNLLLIGATAFAALGTPLQAITSVKLDGATSFTQDITVEANTSSNFRMRVAVFSLPNAAGGAHTVTVDWGAGGSGPTNVLVFFMEVSGAATVSVVDGTGSSGSGVSAASASGNFTTVNSNDFWVAVTTTLGAAPATSSAGASWTIPANGSETDSTMNLCGAIEFFANPGSTSGNGTFTVKNADWVNSAIGYKAAAAATSTCTRTLLGVGC